MVYHCNIDFKVPRLHLQTLTVPLHLNTGKYVGFGEAKKKGEPGQGLLASSDAVAYSHYLHVVYILERQFWFVIAHLFWCQDAQFIQRGLDLLLDVGPHLIHAATTLVLSSTVFLYTSRLCYDMHT